ncbi:MAG: SPOR domain-containing protein [Synergistaceae bacterium]|nr:SPOR domain-containing protein [Synergistaceae bacterium]
MGRRRVRQGIRKRGILPSFGDLVLPIVGIAAVGLLILAGRQFFINGMKKSPGMTSTRAYADSPAMIAERERSQELTQETHDDVAEVMASSQDSTLLAVAGNPEAPAVSEVMAAEHQPPAVVASPSPATPPAKKPAPSKAVTLPPEKQWRVQTGAYTSKAGAQEAVKKINRAGFKARVYQNPASKHFKVWVQGGASKYQAELVVEAMKKLGYKSAFSFPPMKQK